MRWALVVCLLLAGCLDVQTAAPEDVQESDELPPPRNVHPDDLVGLDAVNDTTGQIPPSPWAAECVRQWTSGAYEHSEPPVVDGELCMFLPTEEATLFWHLVNRTHTEPWALHAAPLERDDGFFDWFVYDDTAGRAGFYENGSTHPLLSWDLQLERPEHPSAVRLYDGTAHAVILDYDPDAVATPTGGSLWRYIYHHFWWDGDESGYETVPAGQFTEIGLRSDGHHAVVGKSDLWGPPNGAYVARGGAFEFLPLPATNLMDVTVSEGTIHVCFAAGGMYYHGSMDVLEGVPSWLVEPIAPGVFADLAFTCAIAADGDEVVVVFDSPAIDGNNPQLNPMRGSIAATRTLGVWQQSPIGFEYHHSAGLGRVADTYVHIGATGNGTGTGDWHNGTELRVPVGETTGEWERVWGNFLRTGRIIEDDERLMLHGEMVANPPYEYWGTSHEEHAVTWAALVFPPDFV